METKNNTRRSFLSKLGLGTATLSIMAFLPLKAFKKVSRENTNIDVKINPLAVKRNKRG